MPKDSPKSNPGVLRANDLGDARYERLPAERQGIVFREFISQTLEVRSDAEIKKLQMSHDVIETSSQTFSKSGWPIGVALNIALVMSAAASYADAPPPVTQSVLSADAGDGEKRLKTDKGKTTTKPSSDEVLDELVRRIDHLEKGVEGAKDKMGRLNQIVRDTNNPQEKPALVNPEYSKWASKVELPQIEPNENAKPWQKKEAEEYFLPKSISPENIKKFYEEFDLFIAKFRAVSNNTDERGLMKKNKERNERLCECAIKEETGKAMSLTQRYPNAKDQLGECYKELGRLSNKGWGKCFDKSIDERMAMMDMVEDWMRKKVKISNDLLRELFEIYKKNINPRAKWQDPYDSGFDMISDINRMLIPHGYYAFSINHMPRTPFARNAGFGFFQVKTINPLNLKHDGKAGKVPIAHLEKPFVTSPLYSALDEPGKFFNAMHIGNIDLGYIIFDDSNLIEDGRIGYDRFTKYCKKNSLVPPVLNAKDVDVHNRQLTSAHEGTHHVMFSKIKPAAKIKNRGNIHIGNFKLKTSDYVKSTQMEAYELNGNGMGLMRSGPLAKIIAWQLANATERNAAVYSYNLAKKIITLEILNSPYVSAALKSELQAEISKKPSPKSEKAQKGKSVTDLILSRLVDNDGEKIRLLLTKAILQMPDEELHRIGERMAKLGIYLTQ